MTQADDGSGRSMDQEVLLLGFRIDDDGSQTGVAKEYFDHYVDYFEFEEWVYSHDLPCGYYQFDAVSKETIAEQYDNPMLVDAMWYAWRQNDVGLPAVPDLGGLYTNAFVTVTECEESTTTTVTEAEVPTSVPLVPAPVVTSTSGVEPTPTVPPSSIVAETVRVPQGSMAGSLPMTGPSTTGWLLIVVLITVLLGAVACVAGHLVRKFVSEN